MLAAYREKNFFVVVDTVWELFFAALSGSNVKAENAENEHFFLFIHSIFIMHKQKLRCQASSLGLMETRNKKHKQNCLEK